MKLPRESGVCERSKKTSSGTTPATATTCQAGALDENVGERRKSGMPFASIGNRACPRRPRRRLVREAGRSGRSNNVFPQTTWLGGACTGPSVDRRSSRRAPASPHRARLHDVLERPHWRAVSSRRARRLEAPYRGTRRSRCDATPRACRTLARITVSPSSRNARDSTAGQTTPVLPGGRQLEQRAGRLRRRSGHRAEAEQIAGGEVASRDGVMRNELRCGPVGSRKF